MKPNEIVSSNDFNYEIVDFIWIFIFAGFIFLTQFGSLSAEVLDWDESTFALMAQSVLRGHLPYVELFDLKPPMMFVTLAGWLWVFGESLVSLRLFGDSCFLVTSIFVYLTARRQVPPSMSAAGTLFLIALSSSFFAQHTQTEHLAMAFLMPAIWLMSRSTVSWLGLFASGVLISLAVLTRSNLGGVAVAIGIYLLVSLKGRPLREYLPMLSAYILGGLIPLGVFIALYALHGHLSVFVLSMVHAPLAYSALESDFIPEVVRLHALYWAGRVRHEPFLFVSATFVFVSSVLVLMPPLGGKGSVFRW